MANTKISAFPNATALSGPEQIAAVQSSANVNITPTQIQTFLGVSVTSGKTLSVTNSLTLTGTDGTTMTFPGTSDTVVGINAAQTLGNKTLVAPVLGNATATNLAIGGAAIGTNALAITGTSSIGNITIGAGGNSIQQIFLTPNSGLNGGIGMVNGGGQVLVFINGTAQYSFASPNLVIRSDAAFAFGSTTTVSSTQDTFITRRAAANIQLGAANSATPVAQSVNSQGSRSGTDTNVSGGNLTISSGIGTGNATISSLALASPIAVTGGTGAQTQTTGLTIVGGAARLTNYTVSSGNVSPALPSAVNAGAGAMAFVIDATLTAITGLGLAPIGGGSNKVPVYSDGTQWLIL